MEKEPFDGNVLIIKSESTAIRASFEADDDYMVEGLYVGASNGLAIEPPHNIVTLAHLPYHNNALSQCIQAYELNIEGAGYEFVAIDQKTKINQAEINAAYLFFNEPFPNKSFISILREKRWDEESTGNAYIEVLRNLKGEIVGLRNVNAVNIRLCPLDAPVKVKRDLSGREIEIEERHRRFVYYAKFDVKRYYKEFNALDSNGSLRELNSQTGEWGTIETISAELRATELLHFGVHKSPNTPYFVPRWINQLPSVRGSRLAEEENLGLLESNGIPPYIAFLLGGTVAPSSKEALNVALNGKGTKNKNEIPPVVQINSASGSTESSQVPRLVFERFGSTSGKDALYQNYDKACEEHIRASFRLPPLFIGKTTDYSFATAETSYMVAEAQVFQPERAELDDKINLIMKALGFKTIKFRSKVITLKNVQNQLGVLGSVGQMINPEQLVKEYSAISGLDLKYEKQEQPMPQETPVVPTNETPIQDKENVKKSALDVISLAHEWLAAKGLIIQKGELRCVNEVLNEVSCLEHQDREAFMRYISTYQFGDLIDQNIIEGCCEHS